MTFKNPVIITNMNFVSAADCKHNSCCESILYTNPVNTHLNWHPFLWVLFIFKKIIGWRKKYESNTNDFIERKSKGVEIQR